MGGSKCSPRAFCGPLAASAGIFPSVVLFLKISSNRVKT